MQPFSDRQKWFYERLYDDKKRNSAIIDEQSVINVTRGTVFSSEFVIPGYCLALCTKALP